MTKKEEVRQMRTKVFTLCGRPTTHQRIAEKLGMSGTSASAYLSWLQGMGFVTYDEKTRLYVKATNHSKHRIIPLNPKHPSHEWD
jgi:Mn-dependent DtxR family transcriptional regulator